MKKKNLNGPKREALISYNYSFDVGVKYITRTCFCEIHLTHLEDIHPE